MTYKKSVCCGFRLINDNIIPVTTLWEAHVILRLLNSLVNALKSLKLG